MFPKAPCAAERERAIVIARFVADPCEVSSSGKWVVEPPFGTRTRPASRPPVAGQWRRIAVVPRPRPGKRVRGANDAAVAISASEARRREPGVVWEFGNAVGTTRWIAKERIRQESARYCGVVLGKGPSSWDYEGAWTPGFAVSFTPPPSGLFRPHCQPPRKIARHTSDTRIRL